MIYALNELNEKISAFKAVRGGKYYCPNLKCTNRALILKKGTIKIHHYSHKAHTDCVLLSEPESEIHILGKTYFRLLLDLNDEFVEYYGIEGVRPDVLYNQYALEIQCSSITVQEVKRRNKIYKKNDLTPIWIFFEDHFITSKEKKSNRKRSTSFFDKYPLTPDYFYKIKEPVLKCSFKNIGDYNPYIFSFKREDQDLKVGFNYYSSGSSYKFEKKTERNINSKDDFDDILNELELMKRFKIELNELKTKINSLPFNIKQLLPYSLDHKFKEKNCSMEEFKQYIADLIVKTNLEVIDREKRANLRAIEEKKQKKIWRDWRTRDTFVRDGKTYIPLCKLDKIVYEIEGAYKIFGGRWVGKKVSEVDDKYLYIEDWLYEKITKDLKT